MSLNALGDCTRLTSLRPRLEQRAQILATLRCMFSDWGFLEVETPLRITAPAPETHIEAEPAGSRFLITSPELQLKRLLAAGYEKIFELCHCFRQGERSERHLPEFTMLEWYRLGGRAKDLMGDCEALLMVAAQALGVYPTLRYSGVDVDLTPPWPRISVADAFERYAGWRPEAEPDEDQFNYDLVTKVEPALPKTHPVFLTGYPAAMASLARLDLDDPRYAERFELYVGDLELANGFSELVDPVEQRSRFEIESDKRAKAGKANYPLDEKFLEALELGLQPSAGIALGVDRLVMLILGAKSIDEVVAFTSETL